MRGGKPMAKTVVRENESIEDALRRFKRDVSRSGTLAEARKREYYVKPSISKKIKQKENKKKPCTSESIHFSSKSYV